MYVLVGAGGHGKLISEILELNGITDYLFFDRYLSPDRKNRITNVIPELFSDTKVIICLGDNKARKENVSQFPNQFGIVIHPFSSISNSAIIDVGTVVMANSTINSFAIIGQHCIINSNSTVEHDCIIGDFVHISPGATVCGGVDVGNGAHVGAGSVVIPGLNIGKGSIIGAGAVVIEDVPDNVIVVGNPARVIKTIL